jgi:hypothetical protein
VLGDNPVVLVAPVDDVSQVADQTAHVAVGDDHQLVQCREEPAVCGVLAAQVVGVFEIVGIIPQLIPGASLGTLERVPQEADVIGGELEDDGSAATRRVLISQEECTLLVVGRPVAFARGGPPLLLWRDQVSTTGGEPRQATYFPSRISAIRL